MPTTIPATNDTVVSGGLVGKVVFIYTEEVRVIFTYDGNPLDKIISFNDLKWDDENVIWRHFA